MNKFTQAHSNTSNMHDDATGFSSNSHADSSDDKSDENVHSEHWQLSISRYGVSQALLADFSMLREVQCAQHRPKFSRKSVDTLAQNIVCRNYGNACYELAHLCWAILFFDQQHGQSFEQGAPKARHKTRYTNALLTYFWIEQVASKGQFLSYFAQSQEHAASPEQATFARQSLSLTNEQLALHINGHDFLIHAGRSNFLACLMEWLICLVPDLLVLIEASLIGKGQNGINELASDLQKKIYAYLGEHLPPAKLQRRYRDIDTWYKNNASKPDDGQILQFWTEKSATEGFVKYANVVSDHLAYMQAQEVVLTQAQVAFAHSIDGQGFEAVGLQSDTYSESESFESNNLFEQYLSAPTIDLALISERPKVLKQNQVELSEYVALYPNLISNFSLSWLRVLVFSKYQNQLIQAKRTGKLLRVDELRVDPKDFASAYQAGVQVIASNQQALLAMINILLEQNSHAGLGMLARLMQQLPTMQPYLKDFSVLLEGDSAAADVTPATLSAWQLKYPWFKYIVKQSRIARQKINRQGFTENSLLPEDEYLLAASHLFELNRTLSRLLKVVNQNKYHQTEKYASDRLIFMNELSRIYNQESQ
jgi:hypothetical protein